MAFTVVLWGNAFVAIRIGLVELSPLGLTLLRFLLASVSFLLVFLLTIRRVPLPRKPDLLPLGLMAILGGASYHLLLEYRRAIGHSRHRQPNHRCHADLHRFVDPTLLPAAAGILAGHRDPGRLRGVVSGLLERKPRSRRLQLAGCSGRAGCDVGLVLLSLSFPSLGGSPRTAFRQCLHPIPGVAVVVALGRNWVLSFIANALSPGLGICDLSSAFLHGIGLHCLQPFSAGFGCHRHILLPLPPSGSGRVLWLVVVGRTDQHLSFCSAQPS